MFNKINKITLVYCLAISFVVFAFFVHTLNYQWRYYDENIIFQETLQPIPHTFNEIFEFISAFGVINYTESANAFYSDIANIRGTPLNTVFNFFVFWLFQKSAFKYHSFSLMLHILNSCLLFLIMINLHKRFSKEQSDQTQYKSYIICSLLTILWAMHPVNVESVLLVINFGALITYFSCLSFLWYFLRLKQSLLLHQSILILLFYLFPLFLNEYSITLPLIVFMYLFSISVFSNKTLTYKEAFRSSLAQTLPLIIGGVIYTIYFLLTPKIKIQEPNNILLALERVLWLSPQIFLHNLKLIFIPVKLSIDQCMLVIFSKSIFAPYAIFCFCVFFGFVILSIYSLLKLRQVKGYIASVILIPFFLSLLPFLQILSPVYCLASERYLYLPLGLLIIGLSQILFSIKSSTRSHITIFIIMVSVLLCYSTRAYIRTLDWKDSISLLESAIHTAPNNLFKGLRAQMISGAIKLMDEYKNKDKSRTYNIKAISYLKKAIKEFKAQSNNYENSYPLILKSYGLSPKTYFLKSGILLAFSINELEQNPRKTYAILSKYINNLRVIDTNTLDFSYRILFINKRIDEAEKLLEKSLQQNRASSILYVTLSDLYEYKYNDLISSEKYLLKSFKYFPYDIFTLYGLKRYYQKINNAQKFALFSYLYGLRTHDINSLQEATIINMALRQNKQAKKILTKLLNDFPQNEETTKIKLIYDKTF